jgi:hypothetical protein
MIQKEMADKLIYWIREREKVRLHKDAGHARPWTADPILQTFKFCNVRREDDRVTQWFAKNWRNEQYWEAPNFVPAIILARTINWPMTLNKIGFPHTFLPNELIAQMDEIQGNGEKVYTGAYMITAGPTGVKKNEWVIGNAQSYFDKPPKMFPTLQETWEGIIAAKYPCVGPFIAGQVIADLKQTSKLKHARDWWTWAALGPGSMRGLNRMHGRPVHATITQKQGLKEMQEVRSVLGLQDLCLQDVQNCLCEFDKYMRVLNGEGKPRSGYPGRG